jgi:outer membrane lipoprotein
MRVLASAALMVFSMTLIACAQSAHQTGRDLLDDILPAGVRNEIDETITFEDLRAAPGSYVGKTVLVSGIVLKGKRSKDRTEIEILQLPAGSGVAPTKDRTESQGRFLAVRENFLDPATLQEGTPVTVVGEVKGAMTKLLDDAEYQYPVLEIKNLINWTKTLPANYSGAAPYPYYGYGPGFYGGFYRPSPYWWGPFGYYPYGGPYYPLLFGNPSPPPSRPPPESIPPHFKKHD